MLKKDFFIIVIKLFSLHALLMFGFSFVPDLVYELINDNRDIASIGMKFTSLFIELLLFVLLVYFSPHIVKFLKLEDGIEGEEFNFKGMSASSIMKIGAFIIGGYMLISSLPVLINESIVLFNNTFSTEEFDWRFKKLWGIQLVRVVGGYLLMTNYDRVVAWFERNYRKVEGEEL
ncbi:hypothetical protein [Lishizhenia sp.]|uniref:hypothetical protein n=1 Tax=Lishizhenia sp. TaxID=2497594 RepID=UPI00299ECF1D|nr:hypothetical protein [Lishizhenia sp.]MDX1444987.1 hypothetical protein [Lishizhenia sp.]